MIKYITSVSLIILSFGCSATSCLITKEEIAENSIKYDQLVDIKSTKQGSLVNVVLEAPSEIDGMKLQNVILHKSSSDMSSMEFIVPLKVNTENERSSTWYNMDVNLINENFITLDYGENCGISLKYKVS